MKIIFQVLTFGLLILTAQPILAQEKSAFPDTETITKKILHLDSLFWVAYNSCDVPGMARFIAEDIEFYHDKAGLTIGKENLVATMKRGLCGNANQHLRREAVKGTVEVFPLNNIGAILRGEHVFYVVPKGKKEYLDGIAKFTHVWRYEEGDWTMARILSYDHAAPPEDFENK